MSRSHVPGPYGPTNVNPNSPSPVGLGTLVLGSDPVSACTSTLRSDPLDIPGCFSNTLTPVASLGVTRIVLRLSTTIVGSPRPTSRSSVSPNKNSGLHISLNRIT